MRGGRPTLGERLLTWIDEHLFSLLGLEHIRHRNEELLRLRTVDSCEDLEYFIVMHPDFDIRPLMARAKYLGCDDLYIALSQTEAAAGIFRDPSKWIGDALDPAKVPPWASEMLETLGALVYDGAMSLILSPEVATEENVDERIRRFMGMVTFLSGAPGVVSSLAEIASMGQVDQIGRNIQQVYWNLGLGFVTWQMTAPWIEASIGDVLGRKARRLYRPARFTASQVMDLFALGEMSEAEVRSELAAEGWTDERIDKFMLLSYRPLSLTNVMWAYRYSKRSTQWVEDHLQALGYDPDAIDLLFERYAPAEEEDTLKLYRSTLLNSLEEGIIGPPEFRRLATELGWSEDEINLRLDLLELEKEGEERLMAKGDIEAAYKENVIGSQEARHWLSRWDYSPGAISTIIETWDREIAPEYRKVNKGTILEALWKGVISRDVAIDKLIEIGYSRAAATFIADTHLAGPPTEEHEKIREPDLARFSVSQTGEAYIEGRITAPQARRHLMDLDYAEEGAQLLIEDWNREAAERPIAEYVPLAELSEAELRALTVSQTERLVKGYKLDLERAIGHLEDLGWEREPAEMMVSLWEETRAPEAPPIAPERLPSVGALTTALARGIITEDEFTVWMEELEYSDQAIAFYIGLASYAPTVRTKEFTRAQILHFYEWGQMDYEDALEQLVELGWDVEQALTYINYTLKRMDTSDIVEQFGKWCYELDEALFRYGMIGKTKAFGVKELFNAELLDVTEALPVLEGLGFTRDEAREYLEV